MYENNASRASGFVRKTGGHVCHVGDPQAVRGRDLEAWALADGRRWRTARDARRAGTCRARRRRRRRRSGVARAERGGHEVGRTSSRPCPSPRFRISLSTCPRSTRYSYAPAHTPPRTGGRTLRVSSAGVVQFPAGVDSWGRQRPCLHGSLRGTERCASTSGRTRACNSCALLRARLARILAATLSHDAARNSPKFGRSRPRKRKRQTKIPLSVRFGRRWPERERKLPANGTLGATRSRGPGATVRLDRARPVPLDRARPVRADRARPFPRTAFSPSTRIESPRRRLVHRRRGAGHADAAGGQLVFDASVRATAPAPPDDPPRATPRLPSSPAPAPRRSPGRRARAR